MDSGNDVVVTADSREGAVVSEELDEGAPSWAGSDDIGISSTGWDKDICTSSDYSVTLGVPTNRRSAPTLHVVIVRRRKVEMNTADEMAVAAAAKEPIAEENSAAPSI